VWGLVADLKSQLAAKIRSVELAVLIALAIGIVALVAISRWISMLITRPLAQLAEASDKLASGDCDWPGLLGRVRHGGGLHRRQPRRHDRLHRRGDPRLGLDVGGGRRPLRPGHRRRPTVLTAETFTIIEEEAPPCAT
jgi:hypothetical protein